MPNPKSNLTPGVLYDKDSAGELLEEKQNNLPNEGKWKLTRAPVEETVGLNFPPPVKEEMVELNYPPPEQEEVVEMRFDILTKVAGEPITPLNFNCYGAGTTHQYYRTMTDVGAMINQQNRMIQDAYRHIQEKTDCIVAGVQSLKSPDRKQVTGYKATEAPNGQIWIHRHYDDGSTKTEALIYNMFGPFQVYKLKKPGKQSPDILAILFSRSNIWITGNLKKLSSEMLYRLFVEAGVCFNSKFSSAQIGRALYELLAYRIKHAENTIVLEDMGGWYKGKYLHCENFPFKDSQDLEDLPVLQKKLCKEPLNAEAIRDYIAEVQSIINPHDRAIIAIYPYVSILASLLEEAGKKNEVVLNIVPCEKISLRKIGGWLLVTEKPQLMPINADVNKSTLKKICSTVQDEILFLDFRVNALESNNSKIERNHARVIESYLGNYSINECMHPMGIATISNTLYPGENVCNVLLGRDSVKNVNTNPTSIRCVYSSFISFVEENFDKVIEIIRKRRDAFFSGCIAFDIVLEIVTLFWNNKGYSFWNILGSQIGRNDFAKILHGRIFDPEDLISSFTKAIRAEIKHYRILPKKECLVDSKVIKYDDEWLWVPLEVLQCICKEQGLDDYRTELLYELKNAGILKTDVDGYTRKLQVAGQRKEFYQLKKSAFEKAGQTSLVSLGKH